MYAGIDVQATANGNATAYYLVVRFYVRSDWNINDTMSGTVSGSGIGSVGLGSYSMVGNPVTLEVYAIDLGWQNTSCGGGPTYSWAITTSGQWQGANPSHSVSWVLPAHPSWAPAPPVSNPVASAVTQTTATVTWGPSANTYCHPADTAQLQVARDGGFTQVVHDTSQTNSSRAVTGLSPGTTYYMRSRVHNAAGWSPWSATTSFVTQAGLLVKVSGVWRPATPYVKVAGVWRPAAAKVKVAGTWR
jgi:hypothetical protein